MSKSGAQTVLVVFFLLTIFFFFITIPVMISYYNGLKKKRNRVDFSFSGMDVQMNKRHDLIPNLVEAVKKIMSHETTLFTQITSLRSKISGADPKSEERLGMEGQLSSMLGSLQVTMENYPEIKSDQNMMQLQRALTETEEQVSASRRAYNASVLNLNDALTTFPSNIFAAAMDMNNEQFFQAPEGAKSAPQVGNLFGS